MQETFKLTLGECEKIMERHGGSLYLSNTGITSLPDGLTVGGSLDLSNTGITSLPDGLTVGSWLDLSNTGITSLPDGLTVGGSLDLSNTGITSLPDGLTVGGSLDLRNTGITSLPDGLTVGGSLYLSNTGITSLPDGLTVGGSLYLSNTGITSLPDGLAVGGSLYLSNTGICYAKVKHLNQGDYVEGKYLYADHILTHVKKEKRLNGYTLYVGKIPGKNVVYDGKNYAHCKTFREGIADLNFKNCAERGAEQFKGMSLDSELTVAEAATMYRIITGACRSGTESFINSQEELKEKYTIRELIELTKGQYNAEAFERFFEQ